MVNKDEADAVAAIVGALESVPEAVVQVGSLLVLKGNGRLFVRSLTPEQVERASDIGAGAQLPLAAEALERMIGADPTQAFGPLDVSVSHSKTQLT